MLSNVHSPISFTILCSTEQHESKCENESQSCVNLWCSDKANRFCDNITSSEVNAKDNNLNELTINSHAVCEADVSKKVKDIGKILINAAKETFGMHRNSHSSESNKATSRKPWFNNDCRTARTKYHFAKKCTIDIKHWKTKHILLK